jgi:hypothetical protein
MSVLPEELTLIIHNYPIDNSSRGPQITAQPKNALTILFSIFALPAASRFSIFPSIEGL